jgi:hypothetical protein
VQINDTVVVASAGKIRQPLKKGIHTLRLTFAESATESPRAQIISAVAKPVFENK